MAAKAPKVALVCDWLTTVGGAERVLLAISEMFPDAPIYTSQYDKNGINWFQKTEVKTGWMQPLPAQARRFFAPLRSHYFRKLDLSDYDLVISVTGAEAKGVKTGKNTKHICYCHVPTQYYWQMYDDYIENPGFGIFDPVARMGLKFLVKPLRRSDLEFARRPDQFVTISQYAADQIKKYYRRDSVIVPPPVNVEKFHNAYHGKRSGFVVTSRQVTWKRIDLAIKACLETGQELTIIGDGPEHKNLVKLAGGSPLIHFIPTSDQTTLKNYLKKAAGFIFPSLEPFGIAPIEALAAGCPVLAFGQGGARDYVQDGKNGIIFDQQNVSSLVKAMEKFQKTKFDAAKVAKTADYYDKTRFVKEMKRVIKDVQNS